MHSNLKVFSSQGRLLLAAFRQIDVSTFFFFLVFFCFLTSKRACAVFSSPFLRPAVNTLHRGQSFWKQAALQHGLRGEGAVLCVCVAVQGCTDLSDGVQWAPSLSVHTQPGRKSDWHRQCSKRARAIFETAQEAGKETRWWKSFPDELM